MPSCTYLYSLHSGRWDHHSSAPIFLVLWGWKLLLCLGSEMHSYASRILQVLSTKQEFGLPEPERAHMDEDSIAGIA